MYTYAAGSQGTYGDLGTKATMTAEQLLQQRAWAALPQYERDLVNAPKHIAFGKKSILELKGRLQREIAAGNEQNIKAVREGIANLKNNWLPMWKAKLAEARATKLRATAVTPTTTTPLERSLDPRAGRPIWQNPMLIVGALVAGAVLLRGGRRAA